MKIINSKLDKEITTSIKGIAILLVVFSHFIQIKYINLDNIFLSSGAWGVSIFLLLSGYGLTLSYQKYGLDGFFKKRLLAVMVPYFVVQALEFIIDALLLHKTYSTSIIIFSLLGINFDIYNGPDPSMWFIPFILMWYVIFYLIFKIRIGNTGRLLVLLGASCLVFLFFRHFAAQYWISNLFKYYSFIFPIGVILATISLYKPCVKISSVFSSFLVTLVSFLVLWIGNHNNINNRGMVATIMFMLIVFFGVKLIASLKIKFIKFNVLYFIGSISFEIYLIEWIFLDKYNVLDVFQNKLLATILYSIVVLSIAFILSKGSSLVLKQINHKKIAPQQF